MKTSKLILSILSLFMLCTTGLKAQVCERLDAKRADSTFVSFMVDDIDRIVYQKANAGDEGYSVANGLVSMIDTIKRKVCEYGE